MDQAAKPAEDIIMPLSLVCGAISTEQHPMSLTLVSNPVTFVLVTILKDHLPTAMSLVVMEGTLVYLPVLILQKPLPLRPWESSPS